MNAWEQESARLARALCALMQSEPAPIDLDVALTARAAVLAGAALVLGDLAPRTRGDGGRPRTQVPLHLLESDPVGALGAVLRRRERPSFARSPSELLDAAGRMDAITDVWAQVGRQALIAARAWRRPATDAATAWRVVAEIAAVVEAVVVLDADLITAASGRPDAVRAVEATAGLRAAARATLTVAEAEKRSDAPDPSQLTIPELGSTLEPERAVRTLGSRRPTNVSRQVGGLVGLLNRAPQLTPRHVRLAAAVARDLSIVAAGAVAGTAGPDVQVKLGDLARALHAVAHTDGGERALVPTRPRAVELALHDLHAQTSAAFADGPKPDAAEGTRLGQRLPELVAALSQVAHAQIVERRWAMPDRREGTRPAFALVSTSDPFLQPPMLEHLKDAQGAADVLAKRLALVGDQAGSRSPFPGPSTEALRDLCSRRGPSLHRPRHPADPVHPFRRSRTGRAPEI